MELALFVYLAGIVSGIKFILAMIFMLGIFAFIVFCIFIFNQTDYHKKEFSSFKAVVRNSLVALLVTVFTAALIPSEKTMYLMLAGYGAQQSIQSETAAKVLKVIDKKLDEYLQELPSKSK